MAIIQTIDTASEFADCFKSMGRGNQFSYAALEALFNHLEELSEDTGENIDLDVIGICCDYSEADSVEDFLTDYGDTGDFRAAWKEILEEEGDDTDTAEERFINEVLSDHTTVIQLGGR